MPTHSRHAERRTREGKSKREITRCLKRYIAREVYTTLRADLANHRTGEPVAPPHYAVAIHCGSPCSDPSAMIDSQISRIAGSSPRS